MFIGHFALAYGAKSYSKKVSLGTLFIAVQFLDLLWPIFVILGWEMVEIDPGNTAVTPLNFTYYPYSHSLIMTLVWGLLFGVVYYIIRGNGKVAAMLGLLVVSHWILDFITHRPDLPLTPWSDTKVGLGLWNSMGGTLLIEGALFIICVIWFIRNFDMSILKARLINGGLILLLLIIYISNLFGPPPPSVSLIGYAGLAGWLFVAWGYWADNQLKMRIY